MRSTRFWVRAKIKTDPWRSFNSLTNSSGFLGSLVWITIWLILEMGWVVSPTVILTGSFK